MGIKQAIKSLDAFPRAEEHLLQKTQSGAVGIYFIFSILCFSIIFSLLFFSSFSEEKRILICN